MPFCWLLACLLVAAAADFSVSPADAALGINWGTIASHRLPPNTIRQLLLDNGIKKVKIFDADGHSLGALAGTGIEVMIAIPNEMLAAMNDYENAKTWVKQNVTYYNFQGGVNIKLIGVGNEPFLRSYNGSFTNVTFPALKNIQAALDDAGIGDAVKVTIPLNADVYDSPVDNPVPSAGKFRPDVAHLMSQIVSFFSKNGSPFTVNIYPFLSLYGNPNFPIDYAFFDGTATPVLDGGIAYTNVFDANFDTLVAALDRIGFGDLPIVVGEIGWPTDGEANANVTLAEKFYSGLLKRLAAKQGTPRRPNADIDVYLFSLLDEDAKSIAPGNFERHWGLFTYDGRPKFPLDLACDGQNRWPASAKDVLYLPAKWCTLNPSQSNASSKLSDNVDFACNSADCTAIGDGGSCSAMDWRGKASYALNAYFQTQNQQLESCNFQGLGELTEQNISQAICNFTLQIVGWSSAANSLRHNWRMLAAVGGILVLMF
ncbi:glucan endo-1,3-beta-glucosidase 8-like [Zingiber officinale]|uniref:glucan endo-1,3-beta-glucosidase 8-like n=1 Tax=Zingiber officinale TaxID=94328 RepID=UPI001C4BB8B5|nr:glucan endo-1,3-beta-glucosidase 8-like [Zingiber officinale]